MSAFDDYAARAQNLLATGANMFSATKPTPLYPPFANSGREQVPLMNVPDPSPLKTGLKTALTAIAPWTAITNTREAAGVVAKEVGEGAQKAIAAGSKAVAAAGGGITSTFKYLVWGLVALAVIYVFAVISPFIPKPAGK